MKARKVKGLDPQEALAENAAKIVRVRLDELRSFAPTALEEERTTEQHDMRIAAKRLRYVLEATELCFGRAGATARRRAKDMQDILGELHDCDVMLPRVEQHLGDLREEDATVVRRRAADAPDLDPALAARAPHRTAYRGLEVLAVYSASRRKLLFDRFVELWEDVERAGTWERLERSAERARVEAIERARRAAEELDAARAEAGDAPAPDEPGRP